MSISGANNDDRRKHRPAGEHRSSSDSARSDSSPVRVTIPSDFGASREIQKQIIDRVVRCGFGDQAIFAIKLALEEAMINAIKHGNKLDPAKSVHIAYHVTPQQAEITVEDEGGGFDRHCVPDPTADENIEKCSGRGILLMEAYMTSVEYGANGRRVKMIKKNEEQATPHLSS
ncbi:MAG: ATP-binding protein [Phycisphaerales bacterium]|jgi:serine/threonine-protein kinase RsbW|nr:ATP-binding protein [Phycisphaerales bacterium]